MPEDLIVKIIKESEKKRYKSKNLDLISVKYTGWIFDRMFLQMTIVMQKEKCLIVIFLINLTILTISICFRKRHSYKRMGLGLQDMRINEQDACYPSTPCIW